MDRFEALKELAATVEAGEWDAYSAAYTWPTGKFVGAAWVHEFSMAHNAFHDSVDGAIALLETVLPECEWSVGTDKHGPVAFIYRPFRVPIDERAATPARALLLATLRALIAQEQAQ